jgi:hypothetical protein
LWQALAQRVAAVPLYSGYRMRALEEDDVGARLVRHYHSQVYYKRMMDHAVDLSVL